LSERGISAQGPDWDPIRRHVRGIEDLCKELRITNDPRVWIDGLRVMKLAMTQIEELGGLQGWERRVCRDLRAPEVQSVRAATILPQ
jgi:hypothetical protein